MLTTIKTASRTPGCSAALAARLGSLVDEPGVAVAPVAAHNALHLPRYQRSRALIDQARQRMQQGIAARAEEWERSHVPVLSTPAQSWPPAEQPDQQLLRWVA